MADKKISQLTAVTMPLAETEVLPIVQNGTTKKVTVAELTQLIKHTVTMDGTNVLQFGDAGYTASINYNGDGSLRIKPRAGYPVQIDLANIKFSNAGYGIDFSANTHAAGMTSELLNDYEEGTWTPTQGAGLVVVGAFTSLGRYTRIGRQVIVSARLAGATSIACTAGGVFTTGLPYAPNDVASGAATSSNLAGTILYVDTTIYSINAMAAAGVLFMTATYSV